MPVTLADLRERGRPSRIVYTAALWSVGGAIVILSAFDLSKLTAGFHNSSLAKIWVRSRPLYDNMLSVGYSVEEADRFIFLGCVIVSICLATMVARGVVEVFGPKSFYLGNYRLLTIIAISAIMLVYDYFEPYFIVKHTFRWFTHHRPMLLNDLQLAFILCVAAFATIEVIIQVFALLDPTRAEIEITRTANRPP